MERDLEHLPLGSGKTFDFRTVQGRFGRSAFTIRQLHSNAFPFMEVQGRVKDCLGSFR